MQNPAYKLYYCTEFINDMKLKIIKLVVFSRLSFMNTCTNELLSKSAESGTLYGNLPKLIAELHPRAKRASVGGAP